MVTGKMPVLPEFSCFVVALSAMGGGAKQSCLILGDTNPVPGRESSCISNQFFLFGNHNYEE